METEFYRLPIGAKFTFFGRSYEKIALSMAADLEDRTGHIYPDENPVTFDPPEGVDPNTWLLPERPPERPWTSYLSRAPGEPPR